MGVVIASLVVIAAMAIICVKIKENYKNGKIQRWWKRQKQRWRTRVQSHPIPRAQQATFRRPSVVTETSRSTTTPTTTTTAAATSTTTTIAAAAAATSTSSTITEQVSHSIHVLYTT